MFAATSTTVVVPAGVVASEQLPKVNVSPTEPVGETKRPSVFVPVIVVVPDVIVNCASKAVTSPNCVNAGP